MTLDATVIVIGSGPAGVSAAWPLVEAGIEVLMVDASNGVMPAPPAHEDLAAWRADPARWRAELGGTGPLAEAGLSPKFATPRARATLTGFAQASGLQADGFHAVGSLAAGGLSQIWGALAPHYSPDDLAAFPDPAVMAASCDRVAERIGVNPSAILTPAAARVAARHRETRDDPGFRLGPAPNAVLAASRRERGGCTACGLCLHGCARGSIYQAAAELPALSRHSNFRYRPGVRVERLGGAAGAHLVEARAGTEQVSLRAGAVVLAAGTLATTGLALRRLGLVGRRVRLESNPVGGMAFLIPGLVGQALPARSFGLGQLFYTIDVEPGVESAGVVYGADTLPLGPIADRLPLTRAAALRTARALAPALLLATQYLPGRFSDNRLWLEGDGSLRVEGHQTAQAQQLLDRGFATLAGRMRRRGAWALPGSRQVLTPGADAHPAGTLPLRGTGPAATTATGELAGVAGVFVADGAALPLLSARHPTLTIMAQADGVGRTLARRLATPAMAQVG